MTIPRRNSPSAIVLSLSLACALALGSCGDSADIARRARQKGLSLSLSGSARATELSLSADNALEAPLALRIPAGAIFSSLSDPDKGMIVLGDVEFELGPGHSEFAVPTFSTSHGRPSAEQGEAFSLEYEATENKDIKKLSAWLATDEGRGKVSLSDAESSAPLQQIVWHLMEGLGYEEELDYKIDSMILNFLLGNHPESVIVLLPDAGTIQSESQLARAIARLRADGRLMRERLQLASPEEYASSAVRLKTLFEETGAMDYRARVNGLLQAAGFPADY